MNQAIHKKQSVKWHLRYLAMAELVAGWSKHPDRKVGAVAAGDFGQILSTGFNGWPRGIVREELGRELTNSKGYSLSIHAERNIIYNCSLSGISMRGSTVYLSSMFPCHDCALALVQVGVVQVVYWDEFWYSCGNQKWVDSWKIGAEIFKEANVDLLPMKRGRA